MNKCNLVIDLLPMYFENTLSESTMQFVEEHLEECSECEAVFQAMTQGEGKLPENHISSIEKEKSVKKILTGYKKWLYSIIGVAVIFSLLGGIIGTYVTMSYEELIPTNIAQSFVKYALQGDRWVYQERLAKELKESVNFDEYFNINTWVEFEQISKDSNPSGIKVYKNVTAQEFGPIDVSIQVGLVLEKNGFKVFKVAVLDKEEYLKKKAELDKAIAEKENSGDTTGITIIDKDYVSIPNMDPEAGEYIVEGRILKIDGSNISIEQHMDSGSKARDSITLNDQTILARHAVVNDSDYYSTIKLDQLKVGQVIMAIFKKDDTPRAVLLFE